MDYADIFYGDNKKNIMGKNIYLDITTHIYILIRPILYSATYLP